MTVSADRFGLSVAMTTPFGSDEVLDLSRIAEHAKWCLSNGCNSITLFGTTGEGASVEMAGREQVLGALASAGIDGHDLVYCVAATSVHEALMQGRMASDFGCRGLLLTPPFYFKGVTDEGLFTWFASVLEKLGAAARGVILYNIPSVTQISLSIELIGRLKKHFPGIVMGVKDSSGDWEYTQRLLDSHQDLAILIGDERYLAEGVRRGGQGAISGLANVCPGALRPLAMDGQGDERVNRLVDEVLKYPVTPAVKALVAHRTEDAAWLNVRSPFLRVSAADADRLGSFYDHLFPKMEA
ncbi:dihydrodipicolinate synthase family protein [Microvirga soli]|uniref:dihydrodipicolinate synthase family protein n=1 Tax=Microvirga soli TaxID=1854496 RepID=UPI0028B0F5A9|nr:dihydrodipicolinate synthase family protein [Microvirga soli]